jgi:hypothetical protein
MDPEGGVAMGASIRLDGPQGIACLPQATDADGSLALTWTAKGEDNAYLNAGGHGPLRYGPSSTNLKGVVGLLHGKICKKTLAKYINRRMQAPTVGGLPEAEDRNQRRRTVPDRWGSQDVRGRGTGEIRNDKYRRALSRDDGQRQKATVQQGVLSTSLPCDLIQ